MTCLVASMWKPFYQRRATAFARRIRSFGKVKQVCAEDTDMAGLMLRLVDPPSLLVYFGHGHSSGWTGFRGIRAHHFPAPEHAPPIGCILSFSCAALERQADGAASFGQTLLDQGKAHCFIGTTQALEIASLTRLADLFGQALTVQNVTNPDTLMGQVATLVEARRDDGVRDAWAEMRCIGDQDHRQRAFKNRQTC